MRIVKNLIVILYLQVCCLVAQVSPRRSAVRLYCAAQVTIKTIQNMDFGQRGFRFF